MSAGGVVRGRVVLVAACGSSAPRTVGESSEVSRSVDTAALPAVDIAAIPPGLRVESIDDSETADPLLILAPGVTQWRRVSYSIGVPLPAGGQRAKGFDLIVTREPVPFDRGATRTVTVAGQRAQLGSCYLGDGITTQALVVSRWPDAVVELRAHSSDMTGEELVAVAESLRTLTLAEWQTRMKEHGDAFRDATSDSESIRVDIGEQQQGSIKWHASVLVPPGFKRSADDERRACLEVKFDGVTVPENNCTRFVFGITGDGVEAVTIRSSAVPGNRSSRRSTNGCPRAPWQRVCGPSSRSFRHSSATSPSTAPIAGRRHRSFVR